MNIRKNNNQIYKLLLHTKRDIYACGCRFLEYKYSEFKPQDYKSSANFKVFNQKYGYYVNSAADIIKSKNIQNVLDFIALNHLKEFVALVKKYKNQLPKHHKSTYINFSHLAFNGITDDF